MQTTARVALRSLVLLGGLAAFSLITTAVQGRDAAEADIGGGFVLLGLLMLAPMVWAGLDARASSAASCITVWAVTGLVVATGVDLTIVVRQGMQPLTDLLVLGGFLAAAVAVPAILTAAVVAPQPPSAPATTRSAR